MGIPVLFEFPVLVGVLVLVVLIEAAVYRKRLRLRFGRVVAASALANTGSSLLGVPVAILLGYLKLSLSSALGLYGKPGWDAALSVLTLLAPLFFFTVWAELRIAGLMLGSVSRRELWAAVWRANAWSYVPMFLWVTLGVAG
jgi:hypothetical protein